MNPHRIKTPGGRILRGVFGVTFDPDKQQWVVSYGFGTSGTMTVFEAEKEARRRNAEQKKQEEKQA